MRDPIKTALRVFCDQLYGFNKIKTVVVKDGKFTNHSLSVTCVSKLFQNHVRNKLLLKKLQGTESLCTKR